MFTYADRCTGQVKGHLAALKNQNYITQARRDQALAEAQRIERLIEYQTDCEVRATIPSLVMADQATAIAAEAAKAMKNKQKQ